MKFWAGFVEGKIDSFDADTGWGGFGQEKTIMPALFKNKEDAQARYQDVRRVSVIEAKD